MVGEALWIRVERLVGGPLRLLFALLALWVWQDGIRIPFRGEGFPGWWVYVGFAVFSAFISWTFDGRLATRWTGVAQLVDLGFLVYVLRYANNLTGPVTWLLALWVLKQALLAAARPRWYGIAFFSGPAYLAGARWQTDTWGVLVDPLFQQVYLLLLIWVIGGWLLARYLHALGTTLVRERADLAEKTRVLQQTASDLGARVLELRSLQEVAHQLSTSLHLEEAIDIILQRAQEFFNVPKVALLLHDESRGMWQPLYVEGTEKGWGTSHPAQPTVVRYFTRATACLVHPTLEDEPAVAVYEVLPPEWRTQSLVAIPLVTRERLVALLVLSPPPSAFGERQEQFAESFAFLAATAIENARLYESVVEQRQELEAVLQGIGDAVIVTDTTLRVLLLNPVAQRTLRLPSTVIGHPLTDVVDNEALVMLIQNALRSPEEVHVQEIEVQFTDERPRMYQGVASAVRIPSRETRGVVTVLRDITAQKELERMKSNFLSVVSHELKTPLHSIKGFVEIIRMGKAGPITELQADFLATVKEQTQVLQRMIEDLLVFSRLEAGQLHLQVETLSLAEIAKRVVQKLAPIAQEKHLQLANQLSESFPLVEGDYIRLEQVLTNLVENAIKFTPAGGRITIGGEDRGETVVIWVQDTGIGIPESEHERIFERFYQVDTSERRAYRGAGLGLTICKHIVERHHGRIWVKSRPGAGSTFYVELPKHLPAVHEPLDFYTERERGDRKDEW